MEWNLRHVSQPKAPVTTTTKTQRKMDREGEREGEGRRKREKRKRERERWPCYLLSAFRDVWGGTAKLRTGGERR